VIAGIVSLSLSSLSVTNCVLIKFLSSPRIVSSRLFSPSLLFVLCASHCLICFREPLDIQNDQKKLLSSLANLCLCASMMKANTSITLSPIRLHQSRRWRKKTEVSSTWPRRDILGEFIVACLVGHPKELCVPRRRSRR
jgi:hypothetical protein